MSAFSASTLNVGLLTFFLIYAEIVLGQGSYNATQGNNNNSTSQGLNVTQGSNSTQGLNTTATSWTPIGYTTDWSKGSATFYGGADASGTMGGACGYGNLYDTGYGIKSAALSMALFNGGASCGQCYTIKCDLNYGSRWCKPGISVTITGTNLCPPNYALPSNHGGWCNPPRPHFDMAQPSWELIGIYKGGIIPVMYKRVSCAKSGGVRFTINGFNYFELVLATNVGGPGSIKSMWIRGSKTKWMVMPRNWGANWHSLSYLTGQSLSLKATATNGETLIFPDIAPRWWRFGQTFTTSTQFTQL